MSYIERESLKEMFSSDNKPLETAICSVIDAAPAADVAPVVHGEWREDTDPADGDLRCTRCGAAWPKFVQDQIAEQGIWTLQTLFKYCPHCGAKMNAEIKLPAELYAREKSPDGRIITCCTMRQQVLHCIGMADSGSQRHKPYHRHGKVFYRPWRNYFDTSAHDKTWTQLCDAGYAEHGEVSDRGGAMFRMTRKGLDWLGEQLDMTIYDEED